MVLAIIIVTVLVGLLADAVMGWPMTRRPDARARGPTSWLGKLLTYAGTAATGVLLIATASFILTFAIAPDAMNARNPATVVMTVAIVASAAFAEMCCAAAALKRRQRDVRPTRGLRGRLAASSFFGVTPVKTPA